MPRNINCLITKSSFVLLLLFTLVSAAYTQTIVRSPVRSDFDGDGKSDLAVYRPSEGAWYIHQSSTNTMRAFLFGLSTDKIAPADYDGDGKTDFAVFRTSNATWYLMQSMAGLRAAQFGASIDQPVPGDYNSDRKDDIATFRPSVSVLNVLPSSPAPAPYVPNFQTDELPARMDYDHDGYRDGKFNKATGKWTLGSLLVRTVTFGLGEDRLVPADYNGDGWEDIGIYRGGDWWFTTFRGNQAVTYSSLQFGLATDLPVPADYDGDLKADIAIFRPSPGDWYILESATNTIRAQHFGLNGDIPVQSAYLPPQ